MTDDVTVEKDPHDEKPEGADFFVDLPNGHVVWFRDLKSGQRLMLSRAQEATFIARERVYESSDKDEDKVKALTELTLKSDKRLWDAIDSTVINPDDIERIMDTMISGVIDVDWAWKVIARGSTAPTPDDDAEEIAPPKPSRRANAKRTQVK